MVFKRFQWLTLLFLAFCSHQAQKGASSPDQSVNKSHDPSAIDPLKPPTILVKGLSEGSLVENSATRVNVQILNYPVAENWQSLRWVLNDLPAESFSKNDGEIEIKDGLKEGPNLLRFYLVRSWGESLRNPEALVTLGFFYKSKSGILPSSQPSVYVNSPRGNFSKDQAKKILFDFVLHHVSLSARRYRVHYTLNGEKRELTNWDAYYFQNLPGGSYNLKVEIVDTEGRTLKAAYAQSSTSFVIEK